MLQRAAMIGALALLATAVVVAGTYADSSGTSEKHSQRAQCGNIVKQKPSPPESNRTYDCDLIDAMYSFSVNLTVSQQVLWEEFLEELQVKLSVNVSNMSPEQIVVFISFELQAFLEVNIEIKEVISFLEVTDSSCGCKFGYLQDVISVAIMIQGEIVEPVIELDSDEDCSLFKSMRDACTSSEEEEWVAELELKLKVVLSVSAYSKEQKLAFCSQIIADFIAEKGSDCEKFLMSIEITAFGSFRSFVGVCKVEHQTVNVKEVISGSTYNDCELIKCLDDAVNNASNSISYGCKSQIYQLSSSLKIKFQGNADNQVRLQFCSVNIFQMLKQAPWCAADFLSIQIGVWGTIYDLEFCNNYCSEYGTCGCVNEGPGTPGTPGSGESSTSVASSDATASSATESSSAASSVASSSASPSSASPSSASPSSAAPSSASPSSASPSSAAPSSASPSSASPSSAAPTTAAPTTPASGNCATRTSLVVIGQGASGPCSGNCTAMTDAVTIAMNSLPSYQRGSFSGIVASIKNICFSTTLTVSQKVSQCVTQLNGTPATIKTQVMATVVFVLNVSWGTLQQFCTCG